MRDLELFGTVDIVPSDPRYRIPLEHDALVLGANADTDFVPLGSVASDNYADVLLGALGDRPLCPSGFVGRGDMSRGALMLRAAQSGNALSCTKLAGSIRRGPRAPRVIS